MKNLKLILVLFLLQFGNNIFSQNNDSLFLVAQQYAYNKNYSKAENICLQVVKTNNLNQDFKILLGRLYAWQNKFESSIKTLLEVTSLNNQNIEAYDALTDAYLWSKDYQNTIKNCNYCIETFDKNVKEKFLLKKSKAQNLLEENDDAINTLNTLLLEFPDNKEATTLLNQIKSASYKNSVSLSYLNVSFNNPTFPSWHYSYVEYQRKFKKCPMIGRFNYGNANNTNGYQFELDAYPKFGKGTYAYLNIGFSNSADIFPSQRSGAEIYQKLPHSFEISGGARYLHFVTEDVFIYTAYLGKYYKNLWFAYRPFVVNKNVDFFISHTGIIRKYFSDADNYMSLNLIYGATPYTTTSFQDITKVNSQRVGIDAQFKVWKSFIIKPSVSFEYEEYYPGVFRNRFYSQLILTKRF